VALRYACMINGVTDLIITKADVLDDMPTVSAGVSYTMHGKTTQQFPFDIQEKQVEVNYTSFPVWDRKLSDCNQVEDLPSAFLTLVKLIEENTGVPVSFVSNGVGRDQLIVFK
jgi:adenylosuccinate synthase